MEQGIKKINISGTNTRYKINKLINPPCNDKEIKKRVVTEKWKFSKDNYKHENQLNIITSILNNSYVIDDEVTKIIIQQINRKIYSYKQQDNLKKLLDIDNFVTFESIIISMVDCELKCRYCKKEMNVLYDISREMTQWSVDRIDNDKGHNNDNFHLACLDCNLKRRRRTDEKFLFTKQLNIIKTIN
jgi:hypothetical protein